MIRKLKQHLRFWRADLPIAVNLITIALAFGLVGYLFWNLAGFVGGVLVTMGLVQLLDMIP